MSFFTGIGGGEGVKVRQPFQNSGSKREKRREGEEPSNMTFYSLNCGKKKKTRFPLHIPLFSVLRGGEKGKKKGRKGKG